MVVEEPNTTATARSILQHSTFALATKILLALLLVYGAHDGFSFGLGLGGSTAHAVKTAPTLAASSRSRDVAAAASATAQVPTDGWLARREPKKQTPQAASLTRIMLATHNRLMWYNYATEEIEVVHDAPVVHYGFFPGRYSPDGQPATLWVTLTPHKLSSKVDVKGQEAVAELDMHTGKELRRVTIPTEFAHDASRCGDKAYITNTEGAQVLEYDLPDMRLNRTFSKFVKKHHVNTVAFTPGSCTHMWVMKHNLGKSAIELWDIGPREPVKVRKVQGVGYNAHGLVFHNGSLVLLDSVGGALVRVSPAGGKRRVLWQSPQKDMFLKGLAVVDSVAYFGIQKWGTREERKDPNRKQYVMAYDLLLGRLLWKREVETKGLLSVIAAPHLGEDSNYRAQLTGLRPGAMGPSAPQHAHPHAHHGSGAHARTRQQQHPGTALAAAIVRAGAKAGASAGAAGVDAASAPAPADGDGAAPGSSAAAAEPAAAAGETP